MCIVQVLAKKMTVLYKLSKEQLSSQHHYDFGLRALKSVLVMAGSLKRSSPDMSEALVLMRALRDMNLPKFVYDDVPLFLGLINDLFPGAIMQLHQGFLTLRHSTARHMQQGPSSAQSALPCCLRCAPASRSISMLACVFVNLHNKTETVLFALCCTLYDVHNR